MARFLSTEKDEDGDDGDICNDGVGSPDCWWCSVWPRCPSLPSTEGPAGLSPPSKVDQVGPVKKQYDVCVVKSIVPTMF